MSVFLWILALIGVLIAAIALYDVLQKKHTILRIFPIIGHFRFWLESVGPELRQYIVTNNDEERPFSRDQRRWVYTTSKQENPYFGFGTDNDIENASNYVIVKQSVFPLNTPPEGEPGGGPAFEFPCAKVLGSFRDRRKAFRPTSAINVSAMSYGSLGSVAVEAINRGVAIAGCWQNTGEGGVSPYHQFGGDLVFQIGTGYFGCRDKDGNFDLARLKDAVESNPVKAIEIKLSQGAKPGVGGFLPKVKVSEAIAAARGIPMGVDCISPSRHSAFNDIDSMLDFVEMLAEQTGLPVGIKSAVGEDSFWIELIEAITPGDRSVDFITIDGGEGGTGAAPLVFSDHVALPFTIGFSRVYRMFASRGLQDRVAFIGSGKLGYPDTALLAFALGCDLIGVGREAMLAIGCIQAARCHTDRCPTGVTTHRPWRMRGLDPDLKSVRLANYLIALRREVLQLTRACAKVHPALVTCDHIDILNGRLRAPDGYEVFGYQPGWGVPSAADREAIKELMTPS